MKRKVKTIKRPAFANRKVRKARSRQKDVKVFGASFYHQYGEMMSLLSYE